MEEKQTSLIEVEKYLENGVHIGTRIRTGYTKPFIFKKRKDGIYVIDVQKIEEGLKNAFEEIKKHDLKDIVVVATRVYASNAAKKLKAFFEEITVVEKRFIPGTFTNPQSNHFLEPSLVIVCDPRNEKEAIREANKLGIKVIGLVDTDNTTEGLDIAVPMNNKGRKSLALFFWLLTRELMVKHGRIKNYSEYKVPLTYFERLEIEGED